MSFMFGPYPYSDNSAVNRPKISDGGRQSVVSGTREVCRFLSQLATKRLRESSSGPFVLCMDGFIGADWSPSIELIRTELEDKDIALETIFVEESYKSPTEIDQMLAPHLPQDREIDPVLLFGKIFHGSYTDFFDEEKLNQAEQDLRALREDRGNRVIIVYGHGAAIRELRHYYDAILYYDVTPFEMTLRINRGEVTNLGRLEGYEFRRFYYVDFEVAYKLRDELFMNDLDFYVDGNDPENSNCCQNQPSMK